MTGWQGFEVRHIVPLWGVEYVSVEGEWFELLALCGGGATGVGGWGGAEGGEIGASHASPWEVVRIICGGG